MINHEPQEIPANIKKKPDCSQHALCHCICHNNHITGRGIKHIIACCAKCQLC